MNYETHNQTSDTSYESAVKKPTSNRKKTRLRKRKVADFPPTSHRKWSPWVSANCTTMATVIHAALHIQGEPIVFQLSAYLCVCVCFVTKCPAAVTPHCCENAEFLKRDRHVVR